ncbi:MAG: hypothetical protein M0P39_15495 [Rhodocyclaceae bacterium]|nr:hypothetical protein [Rhodocyclaceae bacterium]
MALRIWLLLTLSLQAVGVLAQERSDWLIARDEGRWKLVAKGPAGRVEKTAPNQEVLRLGENGMVLVMTLPPADGNGSVVCSEQDRRDFRQACASAFLDCKADGGGLLAVLWGVARGGSAAAERNRLSCRIDENAILHAALAVGMIDRILPQAPPATPQPSAPSSAPSAPLSE